MRASAIVLLIGLLLATLVLAGCGGSHSARVHYTSFHGPDPWWGHGRHYPVYIGRPDPGPSIPDGPIAVPLPEPPPDIDFDID